MIEQRTEKAIKKKARRRETDGVCERERERERDCLLLS